MIKYDLHSHTQYSDGSLSVHALIALAIERGISHLAITDHDTVEAHLQLTKTNNSYVTEKINIIKGIELSSQWNNMGVHIVGLNIDIHSTAITTAVKHQTQLRIERVKTIAKKLLQRGFPDITQGAMILAGDGQVGRPHIAQHMVDEGLVSSVGQAFNKYLGAGKVGDISSVWPDLECVVEWINAAGGVAVLAHPSRYKMTRTKRRRLMADFSDAGGQAIEVCAGNQVPGVAEEMAAVCDEFGFHASVGSDFHNPDYKWVKLGQYPRLPKACRPVWELF
ncbi:PHP domain-containing protein [Oceanospirillaceae bacterium]|jgi:predicted metal-dependent phosphoesterase TrpH|nr:PHP domain-containing protein [Oceanospirillaceae bacterium]MBT4998480.1 PHP domain-containing protein [Oceanospirillaceae bacterium]MBT5630879.1 PHP domain-containing protein [Oceanospirillaceae bacterium]MBT6101537.1 PHP domain-containing protein [Oceanospirillaceae bacterium]MBT7674758.1 PHP domain-containing protein [Oceanospirillaceae bacterium]